jgi:uncharacterized coiled-coil protein SlyX
MTFKELEESLLVRSQLLDRVDRKVEALADRMKELANQAPHNRRGSAPSCKSWRATRRGWVPCKLP